MKAIERYLKRAGKWIVWSIVLIILMVIGLVMISFLVSKSGKQVEHSREIQFHGSRLQQAVFENESASRAYILTVNEGFRERMDAARERAYKELQELQKLVQEDQTHHAKLIAIEHFMRLRFEFSDSTSRMVRTIGQDAATQLLMTGRGIHLSDQIVKQTNELLKSEGEILQLRHETWQNNMHALLLVRLLLGAAFIILILLSIRQLRAERALLQKAKSVLEVQNSQLESEVSESSLEVSRIAQEFNRIMQHVNAAFISVDRDFKYLFVNHQAEELLQRPAHELIGNSIGEIFPELIGSTIWIGLNEALASQRYVCNEQYFDDRDLWIENHIYPSEKGISVFILDISFRKKEAIRSAKLSRMYRFLSRFNQMLVHSNSEENLFQEACLIATEEGQFSHAWIGRMTPAGHLQILAGSGELEQYFEDKEGHLYLQQFDAGKQVHQDLLLQQGHFRNPEEHPAENKVNRLIGSHPLPESFVTLPVLRGGQIWGMFTCYTSSSSDFEADEVNLLKEVSANLSFSVDWFERDRKRRMIEEENRTLLERFDKVSKATNDVVWDWDIRNGTMWWNDTYSQYFGYQAGNRPFRLSNWAEKIHPADVKRVYESLLKAAEDGLPEWQEEYQYIKLNGEPVTVLDRGFSIKDETGRVIRMIGSLVDVTEQRRQEKELLLRNQQLEDAEKLAKLGSWEFTVATGATYWSKNFYRMMEFNPELQPDETYFQSLIHEADRPLVTMIREMMVQGQEPPNEVFRINLPNAGLRYLLPNYSVIRDDNGNVLKFIGTLQDITEQIQYEQQLIRREEDYRSLVEQSMDAIAIADDKGKIQLVNQRTLELSGFSEYELLGKSLFEFAIPADLVEQPFQLHQLNQGDVVHSERRIRNKQGRYLYVEINARKIKDGRMVVFVKDVTERKKAADEILRKNAQLEAAEQQALLGSWEINMLDWSIEWSKQMFRLFNLPVDADTPGFNNFFNLIHADDHEKVTQVWQNVMEGKELGYLTIRTHPDLGPVRYLMPRFYVEQNEAGTMRLMRGTLQDITRQMEDAIKIQVSEEAYRTLVEQAMDGIFICDLNWKIKLTNLAAEQISGYSKEELEQMELTQLTDPENLKADPYHLEDLIAGKTVYNERPVIQKGNHRIIASINARILPDKRLVVIARDITAERMAQEEIRRNNLELQHLTNHLMKIREDERARIAREIHDELGQQMTGVKFGIAWIEKQLPVEKLPLKNKLIQVKELLDESNKSMRRIISELRPSLFDHHGLPDALNWLARIFTENSGIPVILEIPDHLPKLPEELSTTLFRIFQETLTNIGKYAKAQSATASLLIEDDWIRFTISDNGTGFDIQQINEQKSFGLIGMRERVLHLKGQISIQSVPNKGTTIKIQLPFNQMI